MTTSGDPALDYHVFGLRVRSALPLPELIPAVDAGSPDVIISTGAVSEEEDAEAGNGVFVLDIPGVATFRIEAGRTITVEAEPAVPERNVRLYLLGSAFGVLLHQRGLLPLHANAIEIGSRAVLFMGASGEGKSTLASWFNDRGYAVVADDVCVVRLSADGGAYASHGQQRLRLWKETLESSGRDPADYVRSFLGREDIDKFDVPLNSRERRAEDPELAGIYVLGTSDHFSIERLQGLQATESVFAHTYRGFYVNELGSQREHWESVVALVQRVPIFRIDRPRGLSLMDEHGARILDHVASDLTGTP